MVVNGQYRNDQELLDPSSAKAAFTSSTDKSKGKKGKKSKVEDIVTTTTTDASETEGSPGRRSKRLKEFDIDILFDDFDLMEDECKIGEAYSKMKVVGRLSARAYMGPQATVGEAFAALKKDILRTLGARFEMHCDSLVGEEMRGSDDPMPILHEPPRRVNIKLPNSEITVSDFLYPGETQDESVKAVDEMFGFTPTFEHMDDELELIPSPKAVTVQTYIYNF